MAEKLFCFCAIGFVLVFSADCQLVPYIFCTDCSVIHHKKQQLQGSAAIFQASELEVSCPPVQYIPSFAALLAHLEYGFSAKNNRQT